MIRTTLSGLWAHKARMLLTGVSVALGVAFVVGTLVFSDTLRATFDEVFAATMEGVDVQVRAEQEFSGQFSSEQRAGVPPEVLERVADVEGVRAVEGEVSGYAQLVVDGEPVGGQGPPTLGFNAPSESRLREEELREGRYPSVPGEVAIDVGTANAQGLAVGDTVGIMTTGVPEDHTVTGLVGYGELDSIAGATVVLFDADTAMELYSQGGDFLEVAVAADDGVEPEVLRDRIAEALGDGYVVQTGAEAAADTAATIGDALGFFTTGLLVFAGISLFVGAFIIANTFTIVVAQRTRELALLRAVGASRRQTFTAVLVEACLVGLLGSGLGIALGVGLAVVLQALLGALGIGLPSGSLAIHMSAVVAGLVVGVAVTVLSALAPAAKATRVPPVAALAAVTVPPAPRSGRLRVAGGLVVTLVGAAVLSYGLFGAGGVAIVGTGAGIVLIGLALLAVLVAGPVLRTVGWPLPRLLGVRGRLAQENALRNPRRTAATASALMIGLGLVSFASVFGASLTRSAESVIDDAFRAEYTVRGASQFGGLGDDLVDRLGELDEVGAVMAAKLTEFRHGDALRFGIGVDPVTIEEVLSLGEVQGSMAELSGGGMAVRADAAERAGLEVGDEVVVTLPRSGEVTLPVRAVFDRQMDVAWVFDNDTVVAGNREALTNQIWVKLADGVDPAQARPALEAVTGDFPTATLLDQAEQRAEIAQQVNQLLGLLSALLVLSVVIALFGIVNTLGLSVLERTAELGLLRAVGATRRQLRSLIRWESVLITVLGALLGLGVGVVFGWLVVRSLASEGLSQLAVPGGQLALGLVAAVIAGVLAAVLPARRAARVDVLRAIASD